jgi:hypothetical protein
MAERFGIAKAGLTQLRRFLPCFSDPTVFFQRRGPTDPNPLVLVKIL